MARLPKEALSNYCAQSACPSGSLSLMVSRFVTARLAVVSEVRGIAAQVSAIYSDICEHYEQRMVNPVCKDLRKFATKVELIRVFLSYLLALLLLAGCATAQDKDSELLFKGELDIGLSYLQKGDFASAEALLQRAQTRRPKDPRMFNAWALWHERQNEQEMAADYFRRGLAQHPEDPQLNNNYGVLLNQNGDFTTAIAHFQTALKSPTYDKRAGAFENLGDTSMAAERVDLALDAYQSARQLAPERWILLLKLAKASNSSNAPRPALEYIQSYMNALQQKKIKPSQSDLELGAAIAASNKEWLLVDRYQEMINEQQ